ncbi:carbohydrate ABC transporter permease, partial [Exiguobacterium sp. IPCI3]
MWFGHSFIIVMAGVSGISKDFFEAAHIDGANRWQMFTFVTLPLLKPILLYIMITSLIGGLQLFDLPLLLTDGIGAPDGSLNTMVLYLYNQAFKYNNYGYAAAVAYGLFLITLVFSAIVFKGMFRKERAAQKGA